MSGRHRQLEGGSSSDGDLEVGATLGKVLSGCPKQVSIEIAGGLKLDLTSCMIPSVSASRTHSLGPLRPARVSLDVQSRVSFEERSETKRAEAR